MVPNQPFYQKAFVYQKVVRPHIREDEDLYYAFLLRQLDVGMVAEENS